MKLHLVYTCANLRLVNYVAEANHLKEKYADHVEVLVGVEADFIPGTEAVYLKALAAHRLDYVLGSVHYFDGYRIRSGEVAHKSRCQLGVPGVLQACASRSGLWLVRCVSTY